MLLSGLELTTTVTQQRVVNTCFSELVLLPLAYIIMHCLPSMPKVISNKEIWTGGEGIHK